MPSKLDTPFTRLLGIEHPIMQGGMHHVGLAPLAAAVSNAGGLGCITALTLPTPELLREEIRKCKALTSKPFGVNITLLPALTPPNYDGYVDVIISEGIKVVETAGNNPGKYIKRCKEAGIIVVHKCVTIRHAKTAIKAGADYVSIDGFECAGHPGSEDVGNMVLLAMACKDLGAPFIASGGIGTGIQLAACLALGADGVNMGTRFMATVEAPIHDNIKKALVDAEVTQTTLVLRSFNNTERVYLNATSKRAAEEEAKKPGDMSIIMDYFAGTKYKQSFQVSGDTQDSVWSCGQVIGLIHDVPTCKQLVERIVQEAIDTVQNRLTKMIVPGSKL